MKQWLYAFVRAITAHAKHRLGQELRDVSAGQFHCGGCQRTLQIDYFQRCCVSCRLDDVLDVLDKIPKTTNNRRRVMPTEVFVKKREPHLS